MESRPSLLTVPATAETNRTTEVPETPGSPEGVQVALPAGIERTTRIRARLEAQHAPPASSVETPVRRLGLLVDGLVQERWVVDAVRAALSVPGVCLATIAVAAYGRGNSVARRLHRVLDTVDGHLRCRHEHLLSTVDIATWFRGVPRAEIALEETADGWSPDAAGIETLRRADADVWLCFCAEAPRRPLPDFARDGVLGLEIGVDVPAGSPWAGATEVAAGCPVTIARVVDYRSAGGSAIYTGLGATIGNSARRNRLVALRRAMDFFKRSLIAATPTGPSVVRAELPPDYPVGPKPTVARVLRLGWHLAAKMATNRWVALGWHEQWQIGYAFGDEARLDLRSLRYLVPPRDRFWADPFAIAEGNRHFVFFEEFRYRARRGRIVAVEVDERGAVAQAPTPALERPYHLSYPFLFRWRGGLYMLPETAENGTVELYRCEELPSRWRLERVLLTNVRAYDATLWQQGDTWWMFVSIASHGADGNDELHLYSSAVTPLGPWIPHPKNPVVVDTRCARSAGPLFVRDGQLYRPGQDCSGVYGQSISISRVDTLDEHNYHETPVERIEPGWQRDIMCVHTIGGVGRLRVVDVLVKRPRWRGVVRRDAK